MGLSLQTFGDKMMELFPRIARGIAKHENNLLAKEVTLPQVWVLDFLSRRGPCQMREVAQFMHLEFPSVTGLVDRLEKQGFAERRRTEKDRRAVYVGITEKGKKVVEEIFTQKRNAMIELFGTLTSEERADYLRILEKLAGKLSDSGQTKMTQKGREAKNKL